MARRLIQVTLILLAGGYAAIPGRAGETPEMLAAQVEQKETAYLRFHATRTGATLANDEPAIARTIAALAAAIRRIPQAQVDPELARWITNSLHIEIEDRLGSLAEGPAFTPGKSSGPLRFATNAPGPALLTQSQAESLLRAATNRFATLTEERGRALLRKREELVGKQRDYWRGVRLRLASAFQQASVLRLTYERSVLSVFGESPTNGMPAAVVEAFRDPLRPPLSPQRARSGGSPAVVIVTNRPEADQAIDALAGNIARQLDRLGTMRERSLGNLLSVCYDQADNGGTNRIRGFLEAASDVDMIIANTLPTHRSLMTLHHLRLSAALRMLAEQQFGLLNTNSPGLEPLTVEVPNSPGKWNRL